MHLSTGSADGAGERARGADPSDSVCVRVRASACVRVRVNGALRRGEEL